MSGRRSLSMDYEDPSDSSGTDDDLPPTHSSGRGSRGVRVSGNGRAASGVIYASSQPAASSNVDHMIHRLEQEAYTAVLRAFGAQSEVITWAKERLMTDLRKELRVSDEQHREFLSKVGADSTLQQIHSMYRQLASSGPAGGLPPPGAAVAVAEVSPPLALSQSRKKQKTALVAAPAPLLPPPPPSSTPTPPLPPHSKGAAVQSSSGNKRSAPGPRGGKKQKGGRVPAAHKGGGGNKVGRPPSKLLENPGELSIDPYVGRRVKTRWPEDNAFYEAVITDYNPETGFHALVYDMDTENETWEWINLKDMTQSDLVWVEGPNAVVSGRKAPPQGFKGMGRGMKRGPKSSMASPGGKAKSGGRGGARGWRGPASAENGARSTVELIPLEDLAKEVDKLEEEDDLAKLENAKRAAKAHEESIRKALAEVGESSDEEAESDDAGQPPSSHTQSIDHEREHRNGPNSRELNNPADSDEDETAGNERGEASDGEHTAGEGGGASDADDDPQGDEGDDKDEEG